MNINDVYGSNYLKASDLQGQSVSVVISGVEIVPMKDGKNKLCLSFLGKEKKMLVNITNSRAIAALYSPETDHWIGKKIMLASALVDFQGDTVDAIRVRAPSGNAVNVKAAPAVNQQPPQLAIPAQDWQEPQPVSVPQGRHVQNNGASAFDDEVPFAPERR